jgi:hypothetical protein
MVSGGGAFRRAQSRVDLDVHDQREGALPVLLLCGILGDVVGKIAGSTDILGRGSGGY